MERPVRREPDARRERDEPEARPDPDDRRELVARLPDDFRFRVAAAFRAEADRAAFGRLAEAAPPRFPPFLDAVRVLFFPRPDPLFLPPLSSLFTVAQARRADSLRDTPRSS